MTTLGRSIIVSNICYLEQPPKAALPVANDGLRRPVARPKEISRIRSRAWRNFSECVRHSWWQRNIHRAASFCPVQEQLTVFVQAPPFKSYRVSDGESAPAH